MDDRDIQKRLTTSGLLPLVLQAAVFAASAAAVSLSHTKRKSRTCDAAHSLVPFRGRLTVHFTTPVGALSRFLQRLPYHLYATDNFAHGTYRQPLETALKMRDLRPDPRGYVTALRIDIDRPDASTTWLDAEIPQPSLLVVNKRNGHAHAHYLLGTWVNLDRSKQLRYARVVRDGLTCAMGGDNAYSGAFTHNPLHPDFVVIEGPQAYDLHDLATYVDTAGVDKSTPIRIEGSGRNSGLFEYGRRFAYKIVRPIRANGHYEQLEAQVLSELVRANSDLERPLPFSEVGRTARSIAKWTWRSYAKTTRLRPRYASTRVEYEEQAAQRCSEAQRLFDDGLARREIADRLKISPRTVTRHLAERDTSMTDVTRMAV